MASARRRGSDRLACQSRLDARGRLLPRFTTPHSIQPAGYRASRGPRCSTRPRLFNQANAASHREAAPAKPTAFPPVITILSPVEGAAVVGDRVMIDYALRSPSGLAIDRLDVLVDGQPVAASGFEATHAATASGRVTFARPAAANARAALIAYSGGLFSAPAAVDLIFPEPLAPATRSRPRSHRRPPRPRPPPRSKPTSPR